MTKAKSNNKRIAVNTMLLYLRMIVVMLINLYTVRVVLHALGEENYGIYNVVAGVITMLASLSSVLSSATQRFYSYAIGEGKVDRLQKIFSASTNIYLAISLVTIVIGETIGLWFVNSQLVISSDRMLAANWVYQFSIISFVTSMLTTPYSAASIAHEDMRLFAIITFIDALLKLVFAFAIPFIPIDNLVFYGFSLLASQLFTFLFYFCICRKRYSECRYSFSKDWSLYKRMISFSGWTLFSSFAVVGMNQIITILINIFFGPIVNAARAIAIQVNSALSTFCNSFIMAIRPPMIKAYAEGNNDYVNKIFLLSNKFTYYCMLFVAIPLILEMRTILKVWLGEINPQTVRFCQWMVVYGVILSLCNPISIIVQATGKMKQFTMPVESVTLLTPLLVYILFRMGFVAESSFIAMVVMVSLAHVVRLVCLKRIYSVFSIKKYLIEFVLKAAIVTLISFSISNYIHVMIINDFERFVLVSLSAGISTVFLLLVYGISKEERSSIKRAFSKS